MGSVEDPVVTPVGAPLPIREQIPDQPLGLGLIVREDLDLHFEGRLAERFDGLREPLSCSAR